MMQWRPLFNGLLRHGGTKKLNPHRVSHCLIKFGDEFDAFFTVWCCFGCKISKRSLQMQCVASKKHENVHLRLILSMKCANFVKNEFDLYPADKYTTNDNSPILIHNYYCL